MKLKIFLIAFLIIAGFSSCHDELEPEIYDVISPTTFPKTASDAKAAVTSVYKPFIASWWGDIFSSGGMGGYQVWPELSTDIMTCRWGGGWVPLTVFGWNVDNWDAAQFFRRYKFVSNITLTMDRIKNVPMDEELKARYMAEMKCARAWISFMLFDLYGPFPVADLELLKDPLANEILERPTTEWMVNFIKTDLDDAIATLPTSYPQNDWGRFTKGTALMIKLKLVLIQKDWASAESIARQIVGLNMYSLVSDYKDIFTLENEENSEIIYAVPCNQEYGNMWHSHVLSGDYPVKNPNIQRWSGFRMRWDFYDTYEAGDKRLETIAAEYTNHSGQLKTRDNEEQLAYGAIPVKYGEDPNQAGYHSQIDWIIYRYADVLLHLSEAIANKNGAPNQEAIDFVNEVRNRAGLDDVLLADYADLSSFNQMVLAERGHELFCEGHRRQDLIRHGEYIKRGKQIPGSFAEDYKVLFPIPQFIINESEGKIIQNPGY